MFLKSVHLRWYFANRCATNEITSGDLKRNLQGFECLHQPSFYLFWFVTSWGGNPWEQSQTTWNYGEGVVLFFSMNVPSWGRNTWFWSGGFFSTAHTKGVGRGKGFISVDFFADWFPLDSVGSICVLLNKVWIRQFWRPFPIKTRNIQYMICWCHHWRLTPDLIFYKTSPGTLYSLCVSLHFGTWYKISGAVHVTETHPEMKDTLWDKDVRSKTRHEYMYIGK